VVQHPAGKVGGEDSVLPGTAGAVGVGRSFESRYLILKKTPDLPLFDERFTGYGYNKIAFVEMLKYSIKQFYILAHAFAVDLPHPPLVWECIVM
jgi:singapore isolate B (sub-type 7) whole genome shotgun sequence assembly, scaffold_5